MNVILLKKNEFNGVIISNAVARFLHIYKQNNNKNVKKLGNCILNGDVVKFILL